MSEQDDRTRPRRDFLRRTGVGAASLSSLWAALEAVADTREDGEIIRRAAKAVERAARAGEKGRAILLTANYRRMGGENKIVLASLDSVDRALRENNAFETGSKEAIQKSIQQGLRKAASGIQVGDVEVTCGVKGIRGSALETMVAFGGDGVRDELNENGIR